MKNKKIEFLYEYLGPQMRRQEFLLKYGSYNFEMQFFKNNNTISKSNIKLLLKNSLTFNNNSIFKLKHNFLFNLNRKIKYNKYWKYQQLYMIINSIYKKLYFKKEILNKIGNYLKYWFEDRILYEFYFFKYLKNYNNNVINTLLNKKLIINYFKYKKLLLQIYKLLKKVYKNQIIELRKLYAIMLKEKGFNKKRLYNVKKRNRIKRFTPSKLLSSTKWKRQPKWKIISRFFIVTKSHIKSLILKNEEYLSTISGEINNNYNISLKHTKLLNSYKFYEFKRATRLFFIFIESLYNITIREFKLLFNLIINKYKKINNWYDFFVIFENQIQFFLYRFIGKINNYRFNEFNYNKYFNINNKSINKNHIIEISNFLEIMNLSIYNQYNYLFFKNIILLFILSNNIIYYNNIIFPIYYNIIRKLIKINNKLSKKIIKYKSINLYFKINNINKYSYNRLFNISYLNTFNQYKHYNVHDYYFFNNMVMKLINYKQTLIIPFKINILNKINNKICKYKFFNYFIKKLDLLNLKQNNKYYLRKYQLKFGGKFFFRKTKYIANLIKKYKIKKLKYNHKQIKRYYIYYTLLNRYLRKINNKTNNKKILNVYLVEYPFNIKRIISKWINKYNDNKKYNSFIRIFRNKGLRLGIMKKGQIDIWKKKFIYKKTFSNKFFFKSNKKYIPMDYIPFKGRMFRKFKNYKRSIFFKLNLNSIIYGKIIRNLSNQLIDYDKFLISFFYINEKKKYNIYFIYNIPFLEVIYRIDSYLKDKNYLISNLPSLYLFKKHFK
jgi:hypothetical protein